MNGRIRTKTAREFYVEQSPYNQNKKRHSFTRLHSYDDADIAYRGTPEYLKQLMNTSTISNEHSARSIKRPHSANEMTSRNLGNPKYKAQEDYYDEVQSLKKELKYFKDDNSNLRARIRRLEEDNARRHREIDGLYGTNKDADLRRTSVGSSTPTGSAVMNLKQRLFKLELQLKQKETIIDEMKNDPRWTKGTELEIQNRALFNELEKQKIEKLNFIQHDYMAAIDNETKIVVRKLETEKRELKIENENLKKKLHELEKSDHREPLSARQRDGSTDKDPLRKIEHLKELCKNYENEIDQMKDDFKQMRRERDKFRDKFDNIKEDLEEIKRERDHYRQKLNRITNDFDQGRRYEHDRQEKFHQTGRSSPVLKRDDERYYKRPHGDSYSFEEPFKKDSRSSTPTRKSNEYMNPRSSLMFKKSSQNLRHYDWTKEDDRRVKNFREKHAAIVIQRGWRRHNRLHKNAFTNRTKQNSFDKRNSKMGGMVSPRGSQQKLGSKLDHLGSGTIKNRPSSANLSHDFALKIVQASLRGYMNRTGLDKTSRTQKFHRNDNDDDDDIIVAPSKQYGSERKREDFSNYSKQNFRNNDGLWNSSNSRLPTNNRDSTLKSHRSPSPPADNIHGSSSPRNIGSKPADKIKFHWDNRLDRESSLKSQRPSSPLNDPRLPRHISPENPRPLSRQSNLSLGKNPTNPKQSLKNTYNDDDFF